MNSRLYLSSGMILALLGACGGIGRDRPDPARPPETASSRSAADAPARAPDWPVAFVRRDSRGCPGTEGGQMWYAELRGNDPIRVTYGIRFRGDDDGRREVLDLHPLHLRERAMFCTGDGRVMDLKPFVVSVESPD
jgi:hypothetical protein